MFKKMRKVLATLCALALVVTSLAGYEAREVKADLALTNDGKTFTVQDPTGNYVGFVCQGAYDVRFAYAWSGDGNATSGKATVTVKNNSGAVVKNFGELGNGSSIFVTGDAPSISDLASGTYTIEFKGTGNFTNQVETVKLVVSGGSSQQPTSNNSGYDDDFDGDTMTNPWFEMYTTEAPTQSDGFNALDDGVWTDGSQGWSAYAGSWGGAKASISTENGFKLRMDEVNGAEWSIQAKKPVSGLEAGKEYTYEITLSSTKNITAQGKEDTTGTELIPVTVGSTNTTIKGKFTPNTSDAIIFVELGKGGTPGAVVSFVDLKITKVEQPTQAPTTVKPTEAPTTVKPTQAPTTVKPTQAPTTVKPTQAPTTVKVTEAPTTVKPTEAPTTVKPTQAPTTVKPTEAPTTVKPTEAPTQAQTTIQDVIPTAITGLAINNKVATWNASLRATEYEVFIDSQLFATTIATSIDLSNVAPGTHDVKVRATNTFGKTNFASISYFVAEPQTTVKPTEAPTTVKVTEAQTTQQVTEADKYNKLPDDKWSELPNGWNVYVGDWGGNGSTVSTDNSSNTLGLRVDDAHGGEWSIQATKDVEGLEAGSTYKYEIMVISSKDVLVQSKENKTGSDLVSKDIAAGVTTTIEGTFVPSGDVAEILVELGKGAKTGAVINVVNVKVTKVKGVSTPESSTVVENESTTEAPTEPATEAPTEPATEVTTEAPTEPASQDVTEPATTTTSQVVTTKAPVKTTVALKVAKTKVKKAVKKKSTKKIKITLKKVRNAAGYQVQISKAKKFKKKKIVLKKFVKKAKAVKKAKFTLKGKKIKNKKKLWVRARAFIIVDGKKIFGKWSKAKKAKVK